MCQNIKPRVKINFKIQSDIEKCLNNYLTNQQKQTTPPFPMRQQNTQTYKQNKSPSKFKKYLTDWRNLIKQSQNQIKKTRNMKDLLFNNSKQNILDKQIEKQSIKLNNFSVFLQNKSIHQEFQSKTNKSCRKIHSSISTRNNLTGKNSISNRSSIVNQKRSMTPFAIVQNIYQNNLKGLQKDKRIKTARIRNYYQKKASEVEQFQAYDKFQQKLAQANLEQQQRQKIFTRTSQRIEIISKNKILDHKTLQKRFSYYPKKSFRFIRPQQFYISSNKVKIPKKCIMKDFRQFSSVNS